MPVKITEYKDPVVIKSEVHFGKRSNPRGDDRYCFVFEITLPGGAIEVYLTDEQVGQLLSTQIVNADVSLERSARKLARVPKTLNLDVETLPSNVKKEDAWGDSHYAKTPFNINKYPRLKKFISNWSDEQKVKRVRVFFQYSQRDVTMHLGEII